MKAQLPSLHRDEPGTSLFSRWSRFWLTPADPIALHVLRVFAGLLFFVWLLGFAEHRHALFGLDGWFDATAYREAARLPGTPAPLGWSLLYLCGHNAALLDLLYFGSLAVLALFTAGFATRLTSVLTWLIVVSFLANPATSYEGDYLLAILAFYLMIGYLLLGQWSRPLSLRTRLLGGRTRDDSPSHAAGLAVRMIQVHFAIILVVSGLHKLQFGDWWSGVAFWYPLNPPFSITRESFRALAATADSDLFTLSLIQYVALAWQLAFPLFAWRRGWRSVLILGGIAGWIGTLVIYRLPLFGPVFLIACLSYVTPEEWRKLVARFRGPVRAGEGRPVVAKGGPVHV